MSANSKPVGMYSGPGGSSQTPTSGDFNGWKLADPGNITGVGNKGAAPPTDFGQAAEGTAASAQQSVNAQTQANRANQQTGFGSEQWSQDPNGNWTQNTSLNQPLGGTLGNLQGQAFSNSQSPIGNGDQARDQAITGAYNQATSRLDPQWNQAQEQQQAQLLNQGLDPGSQASQQSMGDFSRAKNDAYSSAMNGAIGQGTAAQQATFGENYQAQMAPYQQMGALQGFQNGMPGYNAAGVAPGANYLTAAEASAGILQNQNATNQSNSTDTISGGMGMLGSVMSDERVKKNIHRLDVEAAPGVPVATFEYRHDPGKTRLGVIAQDLEEAGHGQMVSTGADGIKRVDYSQLKPFGLK